jgi:hypothetical protein
MYEETRITAIDVSETAQCQGVVVRYQHPDKLVSDEFSAWQALSLKGSPLFTKVFNYWSKRMFETFDIESLQDLVGRVVRLRTNDYDDIIMIGNDIRQFRSAEEFADVFQNPMHEAYQNPEDWELPET